MLTFVAIVHIVFCLSLIALVLLQDPKGGGAGIFGGGGGGGANTLLGATGQTTFFAKLTRWSAVVFGVTCLTMTIITRQDAGSVIDAVTLPAAATQAPAESAKATEPATGTAGTATGAAQAPVAPQPAPVEAPKN